MHTSLAWCGGREFTGGESDPVPQLTCVPGLYPLAGGSLSHNRRSANKAVGQHPGVDRKSERQGCPQAVTPAFDLRFPAVHSRPSRGCRPALTRVAAGRVTHPV
ncbi:hypothetical protein GCM10010261_36430 [Streptomyces pilosus]|uniref:Uncharacterized protein n=1 Tax=Streptomyces pilosus TaxID=28893 RepID=A0A918ETB6_9ACTN|nr:hypothetical protein GCM10010280_13530 [Streptomyces pilosus]GGV54172.1 hypothetical protein GCM10010261_36430 [Streptomyces pilosus]